MNASEFAGKLLEGSEAMNTAEPVSRSAENVNMRCSTIALMLHTAGRLLLLHACVPHTWDAILRLAVWPNVKDEPHARLARLVRRTEEDSDFSFEEA